MSQYATQEYYIDEFKGNTIPTNEIDKYLKLASEKIDSITFNRIVYKGFNNLTNFQQTKIQDAVCYQAEYIFENGYNNENNQDIASYSVLDISVTQKQDTDKSEAVKNGMSEMALDLIKKTGLNSRSFRW